jgi:O-antigen/teichoic acid export membrane protein
VLNSAYVFAPGLWIAKRTGGIALINLLGAAMNTALNFGLIPAFGIRGAALATFISASTVFAGYMLTSQRAYPVPHEWRPLAIAVVVAAGALVLGNNLDLAFWPGMLVKTAILTASALVFIGLGLVQRSEIRRAWSLVRSAI